jgi:hypothetical protein
LRPPPRPRRPSSARPRRRRWTDARPPRAPPRDVRRGT